MSTVFCQGFGNVLANIAFSREITRSRFPTRKGPLTSIFMADFKQIGTVSGAFHTI